MKCVECLKRGDNTYPDEDGSDVCLCCDCIKYKEQDHECALCWVTDEPTCFDDGVCPREENNE